MRCSALAFAFALLTPSLAWAQDDAVARAQALFEQAVAASRTNDYATACPKFAASQKLDPKTSTLLNLASCYELNGQTASAWATFKEAEVAARKYGRPDWAERAAAASQRLEPKVVRLTVRVPEPVRVPHLTVELDGTTLQDTEWEQPLPVDPGRHRLAWSAPEYKPAARTFEVTTTNLDVKLTPLGPEPRLVTPPSENRDARPPSMWTTGRVVGVVLGGLGVASLATGSVFGLSAKSKYDEAEKLCGTSTRNPHVCTPEGSAAALAARNEVDTLATASTALFITGGVLVAGGVALFTLSPPQKQRQLAIVPWQSGVAAVGRW